MSNSDSKNKGGGFLGRLFGRAGATQTAARTADPSDGINGPVLEQTAGKRLTKSKSILIIAENDAKMRRWQSEIKEWGYGIELVTSGAKGLDTIYEVAYDAILLDCEAPEIDGLHVLREIRSHEELKTLFIGVFVRDPIGKFDQELAAVDAGASRVFQRETTQVDGILTALKTALFPRVLQAQPRVRQPAAVAGSVAPSPLPTSSSRAAEGASARSGAAIRGETILQQEATARRAPEPLPAIAMPALAAEPPRAPSLNKKILLIDADEAVAAIYRAQIEAAGYEVEVALDGETGFHDLYTINPDALLLDLLLPGGLSGSEILKKTRAQKKFEKIPILVFTNIYTRDVEEEAKSAGALRLFNKAACTPRDVIDSLNEIFLPTGAVLGGAAPRAAIKFAGRRHSKVALPPLTAGARHRLPHAGHVRPRRGNDADFQAEIRESLLQGAPEFVKNLRGLFQVLLRSQGDAEAQSAQLLELYTRVHSLTANSAIAGFMKVARLAGALEAMLREFQARPEGLNASTKRTLTQAMDFLAILFTSAAIARERRVRSTSRSSWWTTRSSAAASSGIRWRKPGLKSTAVSHPDEAIKLLEDQRVRPRLSRRGDARHERLRAVQTAARHAAARENPGHLRDRASGFESRAKSSLSGGDDFIGKPFSYIELAVKGLIYVLKGAIGEEKMTAPSTRRRPCPRLPLPCPRCVPADPSPSAPPIMIVPQPPLSEAQRLAALHALHILDTPPEERFDRITRLATDLFAVPISAIALLDEERLWYKSRQGLDRLRDPARRLVLHPHDLNPDVPLVVTDATRDERFHDSPHVTGSSASGFTPVTRCSRRTGAAGHALHHRPRAATPFRDESSAPRCATWRRWRRRNSTPPNSTRPCGLLRRAEENYRSIFENVAEGIFQVRPDGRFMNANPALARLTATTRRPNLWRTWAISAAPSRSMPARRDELLRPLHRHGRITNFESEIYRRDGSMSLDQREHPRRQRRNGHCLYYEGTVHDITTQKYAAAAQAQARDEALQTAQVKSDFLSTMSHEIRTPMHGIIGMTGLLLNTDLKAGAGGIGAPDRVLRRQSAESDQQRAGFLQDRGGLPGAGQPAVHVAARV